MSHAVRRPPKPGQIRLIVLDLDGTLLRADKTISPRCRGALHAAHGRGVAIAFNSGRMTAAMESTADLLGLDVYIISYNGAVVAAPRAAGRRHLFECPVPIPVARELVALGQARQLQTNYYRDNLIYSEEHAECRRFVEIYRQRTGSPFRFIPDLSACLDRPPFKLLFVTDPPVRDALEIELRAHLHGRATLFKTDPEYLEFLHPQVDKGVGVRKLCRELDLPLSAVMALGDGENDTPMVATAGWGVAVANAKEPVRRAAAVTTASDSENGAVAEAVEKWVLR